jgi:acyl-CoA thioesterase-1
MNRRMMGRHRNIEVMNVRSRLIVWTLGVTLAVPGAACRSRVDDREEVRTTTARPSAAAEPSRTPRPAGRPRIVVLGDSLTAGLGIPVADSYPSLLQQRLDASELRFEVVNAGVSGDTSAGGLARLDWALQEEVRVMVVALGGNDALRALPPEQLQHNLAAIIERAQALGITVILAGMEAPPNFGRDYIEAFHKVYPTLAKQYHVPLVPFLLRGVAGSETLNQRDGIHPTAAGARIVADNVWAVLKPIAEREGRAGS